MENTKVSKPKWSVLALIGMLVLSLIISPFGIITGVINVKNAERKGQSLALIIVGVPMTVMWIIHFLGMHGHHH